MLQILGKTNLDFIGKRYYAFGFSSVLLILGVICFVSIVIGKANLGIDFAGGTMVQGNFDQPISIGAVRSAMVRNGYADAIIQILKRDVPNSFLIKVKTTTEEQITKISDNILGVLEKEFPDNKFHMDSVDGIGPAVGKTLRQQAIWAVCFALIGILIYIWIRFDFRFGVAATVATFHDILAVSGLVFILHREFTLLIITALLTLAGYSLTDTVVVFDRIRENLKLFRKKGDFAATINNSINEVLSRTIITSLTTFLVVLVLFFFGGEVTRDFALTLIFGIIIGTYSSVFVASPLLVEWEKMSPKRFK
jgi:preprotein translocase subunit SecF